MMKRFYVACLCMITITANAARIVDGINYEFDRTNNTAYVIKLGDHYYSEYSGNIRIPETIVIGTNSFKVVGIDSYAFYESDITSLTLPETIEYIQKGAFENCNWMEIAYLGDNIKTIGDEAFKDCSRLEAIRLPQNADVSIGKEAFSGLSKLKSLTIPDTWTQIGDSKNTGIFKNCGFSQLFIGRNVKSIGKQAFESCSNLSSIYCPEDGALEIIGSLAFSYCSSITSMKFLPPTVKELGSGAFSNCENLQEVFIPNSVEVIQGGTWEGINTPRFVIDDGKTPFLCYGRWYIMSPKYMYLGRPIDMASDILPYNPRNLESLVFGPYFTGGKEWNFGTKVKVIYSYVTDPSLVTCTFDDNVYDNAILYVPVGYMDKYMAQSNFSNFFDVREFLPDLPPKCIVFNDINVKNLCMRWDTDYDYELSYKEAAVINDIDKVFYNKKMDSFDEFQYFIGITSIPDQAFRGSSMQSIVLPENITSIGSNSFEECDMLSSIEIPNGVQSIGDNAFRDCTKLSYVGLSEDLTSIGFGAFYSCPLQFIHIYDNVSTIGASAFLHCEQMTEVTVGTGIKEVGNGAFASCNQLENFYIFATDVPQTDLYAFHQTPIENATLHVPESAFSAYSNTAPWKDFGNIVPLKADELTWVNEVMTSESAHPVAIFSVDGKKLEMFQPGVNILRMSDGTTRKIVIK